MEHVLHSQIMKDLEHHVISSDAHHGFQKKRSCETQLWLKLQDSAQMLDDSVQTDAVLPNFSKVFEKVPHGHLAVKLEHYGTWRSILQWIQTFLANRSQQVQAGSHCSEPTPVPSSVPHGSVLGTLLFLVYINDMPAQVKPTTRLFAEDSLLYKKIRSLTDAQTIQEDLDALKNWRRHGSFHLTPARMKSFTSQ